MWADHKTTGEHRQTAPGSPVGLVGKHVQAITVTLRCDCSQVLDGCSNPQVTEEASEVPRPVCVTVCVVSRPISRGPGAFGMTITTLGKPLVLGDLLVQ